MLSLTVAADLATLDPASPTFESSLLHIVKNTLLSIPGKLLDEELLDEHMLDGELGVQLLDRELGIVGSNVHLEEGRVSQQQAKKAEQVMVKYEQTPQAQVPLFTDRTRALVQHLLQYKVNPSSSFPLSQHCLRHDINMCMMTSSLNSQAHSLPSFTSHMSQLAGWSMWLLRCVCILLVTL